MNTSPSAAPARADMPAISWSIPDYTDLNARADVEGTWMKVGDGWGEYFANWTRPWPRTMEEWMSAPADELAAGPVVFGFDLDDEAW